MLDRYKINDKVAIITGGAGLMGTQHAEAIAEIGGIPILWDIREDEARREAKKIEDEFGVRARGMKVDISSRESIQAGLDQVLKEFKRVDILINNAANDPKVKDDQNSSWSRLENFSLDMWNVDILVGLTGSFLCSQIIGNHMAKNDGGVIVNISSDLGIISPDQRIYQQDGLSDDQQPVKPVSYSVVKHGLIGLTKYLATYWAAQKVRVNAICPGGIYTNQPEDFVKKLTQLIPQGRMAQKDEYRSAIQFLVSNASSYMTGTTLVMDGGRSVL